MCLPIWINGLGGGGETCLSRRHTAAVQLRTAAVDNGGVRRRLTTTTAIPV